MFNVSKSLIFGIILIISFTVLNFKSHAQDKYYIPKKKTIEEIKELLYKDVWTYNAEASQTNSKSENASLAVTHFKNSTFKFFEDGTYLGTSRVKGKFIINNKNRVLIDLPDNKKILFEIDSLNNLVGNMIWKEKTLINPTYSLGKKNK